MFSSYLYKTSQDFIRIRTLNNLLFHIPQWQGMQLVPAEGYFLESFGRLDEFYNPENPWFYELEWLVGVKPHFGLQVIAIVRQAASSSRYQRALSSWSDTVFTVSFMYSGGLTLSPIHVWQAGGPVEYSWLGTWWYHTLLDFHSPLPQLYTECGCSFSVSALSFFRAGELPVLRRLPQALTVFGCTCLHPISSAFWS